MRRSTKTKLVGFWNDKGFYMVLLLCAAAIGISGYLLFFSGNRKSLETIEIPEVWDADTSAASSPEEAEPVIEPVLVEIPEDAKRESRVVMAEDYLKETAAGASIPESDADTITGGEAEDPPPTVGKVLGEAEAVSGSAELPEALPVAAEPELPSGAREVVAPFFVWPVDGEVLSDFSIDELVFNATTGDWRVHTGVDIAAPAGTPVGAIGDGVVEDVYEDELMGWTVVINHGDGLRSVSCGLMEDIPVTVGENVRAGAMIGGVGGSEALPAEERISSHLHLECIGGGAQIDPMEVLP